MSILVSYITPNKLWLTQEAEKKQLIRNFKAWTIQCQFFIWEDGHCPFKSNCMYLHSFWLKSEALVLSA